jgi:hypothetical protein
MNNKIVLKVKCMSGWIDLAQDTAQWRDRFNIAGKIDISVLYTSKKCLDQLRDY